jgi:hypothetical protein
MSRHAELTVVAATREMDRDMASAAAAPRLSRSY